MYCVSGVKNQIVRIANSTPSLNAKYFPRKKKYTIKYKYEGKYVSGIECWKQLKFLYETSTLQKIDWKYVESLVDIRDKYVELLSEYKIVE
jgi:hypothetical protein